MENCNCKSVVKDEDDEYVKLIWKMNPPRVAIDNDSCDNATVIRVDSVNKQGILLEAVQFLTDLNLIITKAYISSDGNWFMDVFNVTDRDGNKLRDKVLLDHIKTSLELDEFSLASSRNTIGSLPNTNCTAIELTGADRTGLLSEICAVLKDLNCNVVRAEIWVHNSRAAAIVHVTDEFTSDPIDDEEKLSRIKDSLCNIVKGDCDVSSVKTSVSTSIIHTGRRLHQMMLDDHVCEQVSTEVEYKKSGTKVTVMDCNEKDYTIVMLRSKDRPKLLFDTLCTLTDLHYKIYHGTVNSERGEAYQEYYIRHVNGRRMGSEAERQHLMQCLEAAIERRESEGLELELRAEDRVGLLSDITRVFRENGLSIRRAEISTENGKAVDTFYVSETSGKPTDDQTIESIRRQIGQIILKVKQNPSPSSAALKQEANSTTKFHFSDFLSRSFQSLWLIQST